MAFFNFIETFFFISLGITFVLVLLLVYHFKQRMTGLEQKCDTMFEIINDMVKEMNMLRLQQTQVPNFFHPMNNFVPQFNVNDILNTGSPNDENDDESEESSNVGNSEDEDTLNEDDEDEDADEDEDEDADEDEDEKKNVDADADADEVVSPIKIINVNQETLAELDVENISSNDEDNNMDSDEEEDEPFNEQNISSVITEDPILVEKIEPIEEAEAETIEESSNSKESDKEVYKKMSLGALKALVISKGLCSDARTMRKNDLLKLLEEE